MGFNLIGLVGHAGAGKDTAAGGLALIGYRNVKFSSGLKAMLAALLEGQGVSPETIYRMIEGDLKETPTVYLNGRTPRHAMQTLGTEWGRKCIGPEFWVNCGMFTAAGHDRAVITDCRFPNEIDAIRRAGGMIVRITRPGLAVDLSHVSEQFIASVTPDLEVENEHATAEQFADAFADIIAARLD